MAVMGFVIFHVSKHIVGCVWPDLCQVTRFTAACQTLCVGLGLSFLGTAGVKSASYLLSWLLSHLVDHERMVGNFSGWVSLILVLCCDSGGRAKWMACRLQPVKTCFNYPQKLFFVEPGRNRIISEECWLNKDCVGKKYTAQPSMIILTVVVRFQ